MKNVRPIAVRSYMLCHCPRLYNQRNLFGKITIECTNTVDEHGALKSSRLTLVQNLRFTQNRDTQTANNIRMPRKEKLMIKQNKIDLHTAQHGHICHVVRIHFISVSHTERFVVRTLSEIIIHA